jgi:four helix bundle protein
MRNFRRLDVWTRAHLLAIAVRRATRNFPRTGYADQKSQLVRAAESIPSNIVEGCAAATDKEFARYLDIAIKSTAEAEYRLQLALDNGVLDGRSWRTLTAEVVEIRKMLSGLRRTVLSGDGKKGARALGPRPVRRADEKHARDPNSE